MDNPKYVVEIGMDGRFYFRLQAENGEPILSSEGYELKAGWENDIESVKENASLAGRYERGRHLSVASPFLSSRRLTGNRSAKAKYTNPKQAERVAYWR